MHKPVSSELILTVNAIVLGGCQVLWLKIDFTLILSVPKYY